MLAACPTTACANDRATNLRTISYLRFLTSDRHRPEVVKRCARAADRMFFARTAYSDGLLQVHDHRRRGLCVSLPSFVIRSHHQPDVALIILNCSGQRV
jgi:hypothetical protein